MDNLSTLETQSAWEPVVVFPDEVLELIACQVGGQRELTDGEEAQVEALMTECRKNFLAQLSNNPPEPEMPKKTSYGDPADYLQWLAERARAVEDTAYQLAHNFVHFQGALYTIQKGYVSGRFTEPQRDGWVRKMQNLYREKLAEILIPPLNRKVEPEEPFDPKSHLLESWKDDFNHAILKRFGWRCALTESEVEAVIQLQGNKEPFFALHQVPQEHREVMLKLAELGFLYPQTAIGDNVFYRRATVGEMSERTSVDQLKLPNRIINDLKRGGTYYIEPMLWHYLIGETSSYKTKVLFNFVYTRGIGTISLEKIREALREFQEQQET